MSGPTSTDAGGGFLFFDYRLRARPGRRCSLQGTPVWHLIGHDGSWSLTSVSSDPFPVSPGGIVDPAHPATAELRWGHDPSGYGVNVDGRDRVVQLDLPHDGGRLSMIDSSVGWSCPGCAREPGTFAGRLVSTALAAHGPAIYGGVLSQPFGGTITSAPASVAAGGTLHYVVWISGPLGAAPCLGFEDSLTDPRTTKVVATEQHELNCSGVHLPVYGRLFDVQLEVPASAGVGTELQLSWEPDIGGAGASGWQQPIIVTRGD